MVIQLGLYFYLIEALKQGYPEEYRKAGSPWYLWIDHRTSIFNNYILKAKYRNIPDKNLVVVFKISRVILILILTNIFLFVVSVLLMELKGSE